MANEIHCITNFVGTGRSIGGRRYRTRCGEAVIRVDCSYSENEVTCEMCLEVSIVVVEKVKSLMCWADDLAAHMEGDRKLNDAEFTDFWKQAIEIVA